ncbi:MAG: hypothetical protein KJZ78_10465 [Bryobacteraceae bacterium]|nr:hypothetical protein [Bryobacteraceae bacterium]
MTWGSAFVTSDILATATHGLETPTQETRESSHLVRFCDATEINLEKTTVRHI